MKYFVYDAQRNGSCFHEFYKGKWDGRTFWKYDSISLYYDYLFDGFVDAIVEVVENYNPFGETEISFEQWKNIGEIIKTKDDKSKDLYNEADEWLQDVFKTYNCFTILGL